MKGVLGQFVQVFMDMINNSVQEYEAEKITNEEIILTISMSTNDRSLAILRS